MGIFYGLVARGQVVLAEFSTTQTNAATIGRQILEKMNESKNDSNFSFSHDRYIFHVKRTDGLTVLCMADDASGRRIPFAFLEDIHQKFVKTYGRALHSAAAYAMNDEFSRVLSQQMDHFSDDPNADRLNRLKGEMSQVKLFKYNYVYSSFIMFSFKYFQVSLIVEVSALDSRLIDFIFIILCV
ncbi:hypothetical protein DITRI_Ditri10aG0155800 [Diplodiscus trichospermus]